MPRIQTSRLTMWYESFEATAEVKQDVPIILIAGFSMPGIHWPAVLIEELTGRGFRVIAFDNRDIGLTDRVKGQRAPSPIKLGVSRLFRRTLPVPYLLDDMADDTVALMDALEIPHAHIVGMSMGGMIAQLIAIRHPERVRSLCSWSSMTGRMDELAIHPRVVPGMLKSPHPDPEQRLKDSAEFWQAIGTKRYPTDPDAVYDLVFKSAERAPDISGIPRQFAAILASPSRRAQLKKLTVPTLILHGTSDPLVPFRAGKAAAALIPGSIFHVVKGYGHNLPDELMEEVAAQVVANASRAKVA